MQKTLDPTELDKPCFRTVKEICIDDQFYLIQTSIYELDQFSDLKDSTSNDLLSIVEKASLFPKIYFNSKEKSAALGTQITFSKVPTLKTTKIKYAQTLSLKASRLQELVNPVGHFFTKAFPIKIYGGMDFFSDRKTSLWEKFPTTFFFLPQIEIRKNEGKSYLLINEDLSTTHNENQKATSSIQGHSQSVKESASTFIQELRGKTTTLESSSPLSDRKDAPSKETWIKNINECLSLIENGSILKIVPARKTTLSFSEPLSPLSITKRLEANAKNAAVFCLQIDPETAFLGATPELLYDKKQDLLKCVALAGTRASGNTEEEDKTLQKNLESNEKEKREFLQVSDVIQNLLEPLCDNLVIDQKSKVLKTTNMQHLFHQFSGNLKEKTTNQKLVDTLHPTPATSGNPNQAAINTLYQIEEFDRGYYAAPFGFISENIARLYVAIRSGLVTGNKLHLFAGTGIVKGSSPEKEWEELELKIKQFL